MNQKRFGMGIPSLNLMAINAKTDAKNKDTVRAKKDEFSDDFEDDFVLDDDEPEKSEEKTEEKPHSVQVDFNPSKKRSLQGQAPDPHSYLKPSQIRQQTQKKEISGKTTKAPKYDLVSARKPTKEETKIPEKRIQGKKTPITQQRGTTETTKVNQKPTNIYASPSMLSDNRNKQLHIEQTAKKQTPSAVPVKNTVSALKERIKRAENEASPSKVAQIKQSPVKERVLRKDVDPPTSKQDQETKDTKKVNKGAQPPSCYYRPPSSRRHLDDKTPATARTPATKQIPATNRKATLENQAPTQARGKQATKITEKPGTSNVAKRTDVTKIPSTARNQRPAPIMKEISYIRTEKERQEILKEFGEDFFDDIKDMGWLDELEENERKLEMNIKSGEAFDPSILNLYEAGSSQITPKEGEDEFDVAMRMMDAGFDAIHKQSMAEKELLDERSKLLEQIHAQLMIDHTAGYTAHLEK